MQPCNLLKAARLKSGLSLAAAASLSGISRSMLYQYETYPIAKVPVRMIIKLADCYHLTPGQLLQADKGQCVYSNTLFLAPLNDPVRPRYYQHLNVYQNSANTLTDHELLTAYHQLDHRGRQFISHLIRHELTKNQS